MASLKKSRAAARAPAHALSIASSPVGYVAQVTVALAKSGDPEARGAILDAVAAARSPAASAQQKLIADTLAAADKLQTQAAFVQKWFGTRAGQAIAAGHHLSAAHVAGG